MSQSKRGTDHEASVSGLDGHLSYLPSDPCPKGSTEVLGISLSMVKEKYPSKLGIKDSWRKNGGLDSYFEFLSD